MYEYLGNREIMAKDITECDNCPLCINGKCKYPPERLRPEPPCANWTDEMIIHEDMYE